MEEKGDEMPFFEKGGADGEVLELKGKRVVGF